MLQSNIIKNLQYNVMHPLQICLQLISNEYTIPYDVGWVQLLTPLLPFIDIIQNMYQTNKRIG